MKNNERLIFAMLSLVIIIWGLNVVMVKYLSFFPPILIVTIRMTVSALFLAPILLIKKHRRQLSLKEWLLIIGVALMTTFFHQILLAWGVQHTTAGTTSLILGLNPLAMAALAMLFLGEPLTKRKTIGVFLGFAGVVLVVTSQTGEISFNGWGDLTVFASMLVYVVGGMLIRMVTSRGVPALLVTTYSQIIATILLLIVSTVIYPAETFLAIDTRPVTWLIILASGGLSTALGGIGWAYGISKLGASRAAMFLNGMPLASLISAAIFLDEKLQMIHAVALVMIVCGVYLGSKKVTPVKEAVEA